MLDFTNTWCSRPPRCAEEKNTVYRYIYETHPIAQDTYTQPGIGTVIRLSLATWEGWDRNNPVQDDVFSSFQKPFPVYVLPGLGGE